MTQTRDLEVSRLTPDPNNERSESGKDAVTRLAESIKQHGILQRLLVRPFGDGFMVVAGHRRLMAAQVAGLKTVPVEVRSLDEDAARTTQIVENLHREDVTPLDEAKAFDRLRSEDRTIEDVATLVGHSARYVAQRLSLVNLVPQARKALRAGTIRLGTAYLLARITNGRVQRDALRQVEGSEDSAMSVTRARSIIGHHCEPDLANAPSDAGDEGLLKVVPSCVACPKRAGNQPLLFEDADREARCTDPTCFAKKVKAGGRKMARELKKLGHTVHGTKESKDRFFEQHYRGMDLKDNWVTPHQRASYETDLSWGAVLKEELEQEQSQVWVTHPTTGVLLRVISRSRATKIAKTQGHAWAGARQKPKKTAAEKRKETEQRVQRLTEGLATQALVAQLDRLKLDAHVDWLADALLDAARSDSLRRACGAFALKREAEVKTPYGKEKETWRDRLARAIREEAVPPLKVFVVVLMLEQGWRYRSGRDQHPALRDRLLGAFDIDVAQLKRTARQDIRTTRREQRRRRNSAAGTGLQ